MTADAIDACIGQIYACTLQPDHWSVVLPQVARLFDAPRAAIVDIDLASGAPPLVHQHGHDPQAQARYADHYYTLDPGPAIVAATPVGTWHPVLLPLTTQADRDYREGFCRPLDIRHVAGGRLSGDPAAEVFLSLQRGLRHAAFGDAEGRLFERLAPHIAAAFAMQRAHARVSLRAHHAQSAFDALHCAAIVVDPAGQVAMASAQAEALASLPGRLRLDRRGAALGDAFRREDRERFRRALAGATVEPARGDAFRARMADGEALHVSVVPLRESTPFAERRDRGALVLLETPTGSGPRPDSLARLFDLTPAEAQVVAELAAGFSAEHCARRRGVSIHTIRSQLRTIFAKTGVGNQVALVALARTLPSTR